MEEHTILKTQHEILECLNAHYSKFKAWSDINPAINRPQPTPIWGSNIEELSAKLSKQSSLILICCNRLCEKKYISKYDNSNYKIEDIGIILLGTSQLLIDSINIQNAAIHASASILASAATKDLATNQITFNEKIKTITRLTFAFIVIQTVIFGAQLYFMRSQYHISKESLRLDTEKHKHEQSVNTQSNTFRAYSTNKTDTVYISNYPNSLSGRNEPKPKD